MKGNGSEDVEIKQLHRIANYILQREKEEKVVPNILNPLVSETTVSFREKVIDETFKNEEQCMRLVSFSLGNDLSLQKIDDSIINGKYEEQLLTWLPEHPFLNGHEFRNPVFESLALATLMTSPDPLCQDLVLDYVKSHRYTYHLVYLLSVIASDGYIPIEYLHILLNSALEFWSRNVSVALDVIGPDLGEIDEVASVNTPVEIEIGIVIGHDDGPFKIFEFRSQLAGIENVELGGRLFSANVSLPCKVSLTSSQDLQLVAPVAISAKELCLQAKTLVLKPPPKGQQESEITLDADIISSSLESMETNQVPLSLGVSDMTGLTYPAIGYAKVKSAPPTDVALREKWIRLRRILVEFRSHSRGALARYRGKIESERVLRNDLGRAILMQLVTDGILTVSNEFYFIQTEALKEHLATSWIDLRRGEMSEALLTYLRSI